MATDLQRPAVEIAEQLAASRRHWETSGRQGAPFVMPGADLTRLDLREQVLVGAQLQGADFRGSLLDSALLMRAALDGARMAGVSLFAADLSKATLVEAELVGARAPRSQWRRASMLNADLTGARLDDADLRGVELIGARLDRASLLRADLSEAVLLEASSKGANFTDAVLRDAALDLGSLRGATGVAAEDANTAAGTTPRRRVHNERAFEDTVRGTLSAADVPIMWGFEPGPDFIAVLPGDWYAAVEVSVSKDQARLFRLAERADLIVVPDELDVRRAMNNTPVAHGSEAAAAVRALVPSRIKPHGAAALAIRQATRLRPYVLLAARVEADPSLLPRLTRFLDTRDDMLLSASDLAFANGLPAHLGGDMPRRGAQWTAAHAEELGELISAAAHLQQGASMGLERTTDVARRGWRLENELAAAMRPT